MQVEKSSQLIVRQNGKLQSMLKRLNSLKELGDPDGHGDQLKSSGRLRYTHSEQ